MGMNHRHFWERRALAEHRLGHHASAREMQCAGKRQLTEDAALFEAARLRDKHAAVRAYRCDDCGEWHVGRAKLRTA